MNFTAAIDISTFIWCEQDYNANKNHYYNLLEVTPTVYDKITKLRLPVLLKKELLKSIMEEFPYVMINQISYEFQNLTLDFLINSNWYPYSDSDDNAITSVPLLKKMHFSDSIKFETQNQISHLFHNGKNPEHKFIAYRYFFNNENNLILNKQTVDNEIETLIYSTEKEIIDFFEKHRLKFEHNPKHTRALRYSDGEKISPLTCYHQPNGKARTEKLFEEAVFHDGYFYNFDLDNNVYIRFLKTHVDKPIYHGHDLSDENQDVPDKVRNKYNKYGKVF